MFRTARLSFRFAFLSALFVVPLAIDTSIHEQTDLPKRLAAGLLGWVLAGLWCLGAAWRGDDDEGEVAPGRSPVLVLWLAFGAWSVACTVLARHPARAVEPLFLLADGVLWFALAWCAAGARWCRGAVLAVLGAAGIAAAAIGLVQYDGDRPGSFPFAFGPLAEFAARVRAGDVWRAFPLIDQTDVPGSVFGHANVAAEFVATALPLTALGALALVVTRRGAGRLAGIVPALVGFAAAAILGLFVVRTGSRAALVAAIGAAATAWTHWVVSTTVRRPLFGSRAAHLLAHLLVVTAVIAGATLGLDALDVSPRHGQHATTALRRLRSSLTTSNTTVRERLDLWANTLDIVRDHPVTGVGPGGFAVAYPAYAASSRQHEGGRLSSRRQPEKPHDELLHVASETGWPGAALWALAVAATLLGGIAGLARRGLAAVDRLTALACLASLIALCAVAAVAFPFRQTATRVAFFVLSGVMMRTLSRSSAWSPRPTLRRVGVSVAVCTVAFAVTLAHYRARWEASRALRSYSQLVAMEDMIAAMKPRVLVEQLRTLDRAAARDPHDYRYELLRGQVLLRLGRPRDAAASCRRCLALHPDLINAHVGLARALITLGELDGARAAARAAVRLNPREARAHMILGRTHQRAGRFDRALRDYRRALGLDPSTPDRLQIHLNMASIQIDRDPVSAARHLQIAAALAPADVRVLEAAARFLERQSPGSQQAFDAWTALMQAAPGNLEAKLHVGRAFLAGRQFEAALSLFDEAWAARPDLTTLYDRACALSGLGRLLEARDSLRECMNRCARQGDMALWTRCRELLAPIEEGLARSESDEDGAGE